MAEFNPLSLPVPSGENLGLARLSSNPSGWLKEHSERSEVKDKPRKRASSRERNGVLNEGENELCQRAQNLKQLYQRGDNKEEGEVDKKKTGGGGKWLALYE